MQNFLKVIAKLSAMLSHFQMSIDFDGEMVSNMVNEPQVQTFFL